MQQLSWVLLRVAEAVDLVEQVAEAVDLVEQVAEAVDLVEQVAEAVDLVEQVAEVAAVAEVAEVAAVAAVAEVAAVPVDLHLQAVGEVGEVGVKDLYLQAVGVVGVQVAEVVEAVVRHLLLRDNVLDYKRNNSFGGGQLFLPGYSYVEPDRSCS